MLPQLTPLNGGFAGASVQVPPPPRFRAPVGRIRDVRLNPVNPFRDQRGNTPAKHAGLVYERKVQKFLSGVFGAEYFVSPMLHFADDTGARTCIPDGLCIRGDDVVIVEIKYQHMPEAWWQLCRLYEPVVRAWRPTSKVATLEVCRTYDPATPFPTSVRLLDSISDPIPGDAFAVLRLRP